MNINSFPLVFPRAFKSGGEAIYVHQFCKFRVQMTSNDQPEVSNFYYYMIQLTELKFRLYCLYSRKSLSFTDYKSNTCNARLPNTMNNFVL